MEKNILVNFRVNEKLLEKFDKKAAEKGVNRTELLKFLMLKEIERNEE